MTRAFFKGNEKTNLGEILKELEEYNCIYVDGGDSKDLRGKLLILRKKLVELDPEKVD